MGTQALLRRAADYARAAPGEVGLIALLSAAIVAGSAFLFVRSNEPAPPPMQRTEARAEVERVLVVHVAGAVAAPGVYELPMGSRVRDAIAAAGGPAEGADLDSLNLAALLSDGEKVHVPKAGEAAGSDGAGAAQGKLNLNSATARQLETLPGIGPVLAERIVAYRQMKGRFTSIRQLLEVEGIGAKKYEAIKGLVTV